MAMQVLLTCAVLLSSSVYTLLCWVSCIPLLIEHVFAAAVQRKQLASKLPLTLLASLAGTGECWWLFQILVLTRLTVLYCPDSSECTVLC